MNKYPMLIAFLLTAMLSACGSAESADLFTPIAPAFTPVNGAGYVVMAEMTATAAAGAQATSQAQIAQAQAVAAQETAAAVATQQYFAVQPTQLWIEQQAAISTQQAQQSAIELSAMETKQAADASLYATQQAVVADAAVKQATQQARMDQLTIETEAARQKAWSDASWWGIIIALMVVGGLLIALAYIIAQLVHGLGQQAEELGQAIAQIVTSFAMIQLMNRIPTGYQLDMETGRIGRVVDAQPEPALQIESKPEYEVWRAKYQQSLERMMQVSEMKNPLDAKGRLIGWSQRAHDENGIAGRYAWDDFTDIGIKAGLLEDRGKGGTHWAMSEWGFQWCYARYRDVVVDGRVFYLYDGEQPSLTVKDTPYLVVRLPRKPPLPVQWIRGATQIHRESQSAQVTQTSQMLPRKLGTTQMAATTLGDMPDIEAN